LLGSPAVPNIPSVRNSRCEYGIEFLLMLAHFIVSILYTDEMAWKIGKKSCYTWFFDAIQSVYYCCGVDRGKDVLTGVLGENVTGIGITDNCHGYEHVFSPHQLC
jgi:hypothetical protein